MYYRWVFDMYNTGRVCGTCVLWTHGVTPTSVQLYNCIITVLSQYYHSIITVLSVYYQCVISGYLTCTIQVESVARACCEFMASHLHLSNCVIVLSQSYHSIITVLSVCYQCVISGYLTCTIQVESVACACCEFMASHLHPSNCVIVLSQYYHSNISVLSVGIWHVQYRWSQWHVRAVNSWHHTYICPLVPLYYHSIIIVLSKYYQCVISVLSVGIWHVQYR